MVNIFNHEVVSILKGRDNPVCIVTVYVVESKGIGFRLPTKEKMFSLFFYILFTPDLRPTKFSVPCVTGDFSSGVKRLGSEADHSPSSYVEIKNGETTHSLPHSSSWGGT
jgi:hypothetical protein